MEGHNTVFAHLCSTMPTSLPSIAISERWKLTWAISSAMAVAIITFLGLLSPSQAWLQHGGKHLIGPAFSGCITAAVKDVTFGATLFNGVACTLACFVASFISYIVFAIAGEGYDMRVAIPVVFVVAFTMQYIEFHVLGKKLAISMIAINLLVQKVPSSPSNVFLLYTDVLIGILCALIGALLPWPQFSRADLRGRLRFNVEAVAVLLEDTYAAWQYQCVPVNVHKTHPWAVPRPSTYEVRDELSKLFDENMLLIQMRMRECVFLPWESATEKSSWELIVLLEDLRLALKVVEAKLADMKAHRSSYHVHFAFQCVDSFREALQDLTAESAALLLQLAETRRPLRNNAADSLLASIRALESAYTAARERIYWTPTGSVSPTADVLLNMNSILFLLDIIALRILEFSRALELNEMQLPPLTASSFLVSLYRGVEQPVVFEQIKVFGEDGALTSAARRRLRQCFCLAISMSVAAIYGYISGRDLGFVAAFTIAFLTGDDVAGASVLTSLNRASGTVLASVYTAIVLIIANSSAVLPNRDLFIGFATVLFQLPATYIRTFTASGYIGTVAAFTVPILLLQTTVSVDVAFNRIIDTYVGVCIYLFVDYLVAPHYSDDILLHEMDHVYARIKEHFRFFKDGFESKFTELHSTSLSAHIRKVRGVLLYSSHEVSFFRPPSFPAAIIEEIMHYQEVAHSNMQIMTWASIECVRQGTYFSVLRRELAKHLENIADFIENTSEHLTSSKRFLREGTSSSHLSIQGELRSLLHGGSRVRGEDKVDESLNIMTQYEESIRALLLSHKEGSPQEFISSFEVKLVNTLFASSKRLLDSLHGLTKAQMRMSAYRNLRINHDGFKKDPLV